MLLANETTVQTLVKTDKRDALKLASLLEAGRLKGITVRAREGRSSKTAHPYSTTTNRRADGSEEQDPDEMPPNRINRRR